MKHFFRRYWVLLAVLSVALLVGTVSVFWARQRQAQIDRAANTSHQQYRSQLAASQRTLAERLAREAEAKKLAVEAEVKRVAEAEARKAAELARNAERQRQQATVSVLHRNPASIDVVVNKKNPLIPLDFTPLLASVPCSGFGTVLVAQSAGTDLTALCEVAVQAGVPVGVSSSYRSYATQVSTYNYWVGRDGQAVADSYSARPGYSEHQTGLALDFRVPGGATLDSFTGTAQQLWLAENAWRYGFIQRYTGSGSAETGYSAESWHYRYVGRDVATVYMQSGATSLETYWGVSGGGY